MNLLENKSYSDEDMQPFMNMMGDYSETYTNVKLRYKNPLENAWDDFKKADVNTKILQGTEFGLNVAAIVASLFGGDIGAAADSAKSGSGMEVSNGINDSLNLSDDTKIADDIEQIGNDSKDADELGKLTANGVGKTQYDNIDINNLKESNPVELDNIINDIRENGGSPLDIPENATINAKSMNKGYQQIKYNWSDGTYKYEARWHTETPGAVQYDRGTTWVVTRKIPGNAQGQRSVTECLAGDKWVSLKVWKDAEIANMVGTATQEQKDLLESGHWLAK